MSNEVGDAYSLRAQEYVTRFGSMDAVHPEDREFVETWARSIAPRGNVIDAGCGPGQWTSFLVELGLSARGIDLVPEFIERAQRTYPRIDFATGSLNALEVPDESLDAVLAWFSVIHHEPAEIQLPLQEFRRALRPGGTLLIGFFEGPIVEQFAHAVVPAYRWPVDELSDELHAAGFELDTLQVRRPPGERPQAIIVSHRRMRILP
ncbi:bifunctional 2-polyprenyl-6-hydroxyphenol methylase/3-demethylubiquinol 3-O-methyltransferase UbiG [Salinibacterium sp. SWN248]|uniref:class I SAM-dependent methyltransferase n=1 Tax=Salinibacterium sp. SWN248 TaxID=2792056 RepID=UPI0018CFE83E|nr:class I SAM-dependent methyltransferase [Salinibacterium sp. SWN248]MBH0022936.1 class I SAM-dependent methyltransferase [Salinibacterium sp. SWN248]